MASYEPPVLSRERKSRPSNRVRAPVHGSSLPDVACEWAALMDPVCPMWRVREPIMDPVLDVACERAYYGPNT